MVAAVSSGQRSFRELAIEVGLLSGRTLSKQSLSDRMNSKAVDFFRELVAADLRRATASVPLLNTRGLTEIRRILIGDSSAVPLHPSLVQHFPGPTNQTDQQGAQLKLQLTFDLLGGRWLKTTLDPYPRSDHEAGLNLLPEFLHAGDLLIRDLAYSSVRCFKAIADRGAFYLSRLRSKTAVMDLGGNRVDLLRLARQYAPGVGHVFTRNILLGADDKLPTRLVILRVPEAVANQRRRHLRQQAKRQKTQLRKERLALADWMIFVTNLSEEQAGVEQLHQLYQMRWRIENLFKLCKSHTGLLKIARHRTNRHHVEILILAWLLLMISLSQQGIFRLYDTNGSGDSKVMEASIFKSIGRILHWVTLGIELSRAGSITALLQRLGEQQAYHDRYERRKRISLPQRLLLALNSHQNPNLIP